MMLDRVGVEAARATSIVRYAPDSWFPHHFHPGGEEILVLSGIFSEGETHYPAGWYLRSPPGSGHQPSSREGALIFVKLWQMQPDDRSTVRIDTRDPATWFRRDGRDVCMLFSDEREQVCLERLGAGDALFAEAVDGAELLVLSGTLTAKGRSFPQGSWIRLPAGRYPEFVAGTQGASLYVKVGRAVVEERNDMQIHPVAGWTIWM